ncbi:hypothetical protein [Spirillospora sp. NPDC029432]|uniref:hypothetical protein n=1 Tax=Spirillospora sp. NPDC029432 TaxID=3154599 RepID=UPI003451965C
MDGKHKEPGPASESWFGTAARGLVPIGIASCAALVIGGGVDLVHQHQASGKKERAAKPAAERDETGPRYVVGVRDKGAALVVRDVRTGHDVGLPVAAPAGQRFQRVAVAGERSFVVATKAGAQVTFQKLKLSEDGEPQKLTGLPDATVSGVSTAWSDLAVEPESDRIAYVTYRRGGGSRVDVVAADGTGRKAWTSKAPARIGNMSWAGSTLSFVYTPVKKAAGRTVHQLRALDTNAASGDLRASKAVMRLPKGASAAVLSRDGRSVLAGAVQNGQLTVQSYDAATGAPAKALWKGRLAGTAPRLDLDRTGEHVLAAGSDGRLRGPAGQSVPAEDLLDAAW